MGGLPLLGFYVFTLGGSGYCSESLSKQKSESQSKFIFVGGMLSCVVVTDYFYRQLDQLTISFLFGKQLIKTYDPVNNILSVNDVEVMQNLVKWFIKTINQHELFFEYSEPQPTKEQINVLFNYFQSSFPQLSLSAVITRLHSQQSFISGSTIVPPLIYDQIMTIHSKMFDHVTETIDRKILKIRLPSQLTQDPIIHIDFKEVNKNTTIATPPSLRISEEQKSCFKICDIINQSKPNLLSVEDKKQFQLKQHIVRCFTNKGFGMTKWREYCSDHGYDSKQPFRIYFSTASSIVMKTFRSIQRFLQQNCSICVELLSKHQNRMIYWVLLKLKDFASEQMIRIFCSFMTSLYSLAQQNTKVQTFLVYRTYQTILKILVVREKEVAAKRNNDQEKLSIFNQKKDRLFYLKGNKNEKAVIERWDSVKQAQLANFYLQTQQLVKIRQKYRQLYGCTTMFENIQHLRSQFYKIIRKSLRRAQKVTKVYTDKFSKQTVNIIHLRNRHRNVRWILTNPQFAKTRVLLCQLFNQKQKALDLIQQIANEIAIGLANRDKTERVLYPAVKKRQN